VIVRGDLDIPEGDFTRLEKSEKTYEYLLSQKAKIIVIGHRGRPEDKTDDNLSLAPIAKNLQSVLGAYVKFINDTTGNIAQTEVNSLNPGEILMLENLRFDKGEEGNDDLFAERLASYGDFYVNECFSSSHRNHASFVGIPKLLPHAAGIRFAREIEKLSKVLQNPKRPIVLVLGGLKEGKLKYLDSFTKIADKVLVGGRLPEFLQNIDHKLIVANLTADKEDMTVRSIELFEAEIAKAGTVVVSGPLGKFEDEGHRLGTERVFKAIIASDAYKVAGGGDTEAAISMFGLEEKFDWISVGGGAMLEFLASGTLPGIEALID